MYAVSVVDYTSRLEIPEPIHRRGTGLSLRAAFLKKSCTTRCWSWLYEVSRLQQKARIAPGHAVTWDQ